MQIWQNGTRWLTSSGGYPQHRVSVEGEPDQARHAEVIHAEKLHHAPHVALGPAANSAF